MMSTDRKLFYNNLQPLGQCLLSTSVAPETRLDVDIRVALAEKRVLRSERKS
jgi:hypothetical protein